jgi:hypothetical protein
MAYLQWTESGGKPTLMKSIKTLWVSVLAITLTKAIIAPLESLPNAMRTAGLALLLLLLLVGQRG